jgi:hypothetical protein
MLPRVLFAVAILLNVAPTRAHAKEPDGLVVGSFSRPLPMTDPRFQFEGGCAIEARDLRRHKKTTIRAPRNSNDCLRTPRMSPDGARVLFEADSRPDADRHAREVELRLVRSDGRGERSVATRDFHEQIVYAWSPDSTLIAVTERDEFGRADKYARWLIIDPDAKRVWSMKPCAAQLRNDVLQWAPDGQGLIVASQPHEGNRLLEESPLLRCDFAGGRRELLPKIPVGTKLALSPDARSLLLLEYESNVVVTVATGERRAVWKGAALSLPIWSPDGNWIGAMVPPKPNFVPELVLFDLRSNKATHTRWFEDPFELSWWAPWPKGVDCGALVRAALGPGQEISLPLRIDLKTGAR